MQVSITIEEATVSNVNLGSEGSGEGQQSRTDWKLNFVAQAALIHSLFLVDMETLETMFWDESGEVLGGISCIDLSHQHRHNLFSFIGVESSMFEDEVDKYTFHAANVTVQSIKVVPMPHQLAEVTLTAQIRSPDAHQLELAALYQKRKGKLIIQYEAPEEAVGSPDDDEDPGNDVDLI